MDTATNKLATLSPKSAEQIMEAERIHDVLLLLENLSCREETTVKLILDCLYDVGSANLINQKFRSRTVNGTLKMIARSSKPVFRMIAWRWVKKNCPQLITDWLYEQVKFQKATPKKAEIVVENAQIPTDYPIKSADQTREIRYLRSQVRLLVAVCMIAITSFGGSFFWLSYKLEQTHLQTMQELQTQLKTKQTSVNTAD
ncbi:hypothetical protein [Anabaena sp. CCY 9402-a]|uniref:hypothetical protein n=1 Tax=Anabaena sp. CCY 9402-a TaxID=3103867 RepID=UPI0039C60975